MPDIMWTPMNAPADDWSRETAARMLAEGYSHSAVIRKLEAYGCGFYAARGILITLTKGAA
jgi:hypothetical protein